MNKYFFTTVLFLCATLATAQELGNFANRRQIVSPEIKDGNVTFRLSAPGAKEVGLYGNWMEFGASAMPLTLKAEGVWEITLPLPVPDIYTYNFIVDGATAGDPANFLMQRDGTRYLSMLFVDGEKTTNYKEAGKRGNLKAVWYDSPTLGMNRRIPYGYETDTQKYPTLYLLHGGGGDEDAWSNMGRACQILDNLIEQGKARPMLVVMPNGNPGQQAARTLMLEEKPFEYNNPATANLYINSLAKDIVPFIEKNYRVIAERESRAVAGLSMGGGHTWSNWRDYLNTMAPMLFK
ncbi:MAG: esterase [Tannerellaceae bacterium]|jgi:enterochelin esterase family protein|nr:esterase [Tannerellaceae bacterium]